MYTHAYLILLSVCKFNVNVHNMVITSFTHTTLLLGMHDGMKLINHPPLKLNTQLAKHLYGCIDVAIKLNKQTLASYGSKTVMYACVYTLLYSIM